MKHQRSAYVSLRFHHGVLFSTSGGARSALVAFWLKGRGGQELASFDGSDLYASSALLYARPDRIHRRWGWIFPVGIRLPSQETRCFWFRCFLGPPSTKNQIGGVGFPMTVAEPGAVGGKVSFLDALPPNVEAGKLRLWDVNQLTLWEVNLF